MGIFDFLKTKEIVPYEKIYKELDIFTAESLAMPQTNNPFLLDDNRNHPIIFGYFMGVIDFMAQAYKLNEKDKRTIQTQYILKNFTDNSEEDAEELLKYCTKIKQNDDVNNYELRGKLAMKKWKKGGRMAECAPMALMRMLND